jgi:hypothetical protein
LNWICCSLECLWTNDCRQSTIDREFSRIHYNPQTLMYLFKRPFSFTLLGTICHNHRTWRDIFQYCAIQSQRTDIMFQRRIISKSVHIAHCCTVATISFPKDKQSLFCYQINSTITNHRL